MRSLLCDPLSPYLATPGDRAETMQPKLLDAAVLHPQPRHAHHVHLPGRTPFIHLGFDQPLTSL